LFKNYQEELEILNSFQKLIYNQHSATSRRVPPEAPTTPLATPLEGSQHI